MLSTIRTTIRTAAHADEAAIIADLTATAALTTADRAAIATQGADWVRQVRLAANPGMMEAFLSEYGLSTEEGVALMCLAEALLRVPDAETIDDLIRDKITPHDWGAHLGGAASSLVNASTWALMLTGQVLEDGNQGLTGALRGMVRRMGEPVIRTAVARAMREMAAQFVLGRTIEEAMNRGAAMVAKGYVYSYDMLGEAAMTHADASRYFTAYDEAIASIAKQAPNEDIRANPGISVKLSALHPRYEVAQAEQMMPLLAERLLHLAQAAKAGCIGLNIDAEEAERLDLSMDVIETVLSD
ncbi:MAG: proline dehydrogenase family protein, partial [Pikeienuella sp.]